MNIQNPHDHWIDPTYLHGWSAWQFMLAWLAVFLLGAVAVFGAKAAADEDRDGRTRMAGAIVSFAGALSAVWVMERLTRHMVHTESAIVFPIVVFAAIGFLLWFVTSRWIIGTMFAVVSSMWVLLNDQLIRHGHGDFHTAAIALLALAFLVAAVVAGISEHRVRP